MAAVSGAAVEQRTQELGRALLEEAARFRPGPAERVQDWLLTHAVADDRFRSRLLRYLDVLAALDYDEGGREAKRLAQEYFGDRFPELPRVLRWLLRVARNELIPAPLVGETARRSAELFARRFITPPGEETVRATTTYLAEHGRYPSFDLLGEAVLSDAEAEAYLDGYLSLIERLSRDPAAGARTAGDVPALQLSLKLSSLTSHFSSIDPEGTLSRVRPALETIAEAAQGAGVGIAVDMEQYELHDLTWELFRRTFARGERFGAWPDAGIVLQGYLRDAEGQAAEMIAFARERGTPFQLRLVKGAYWDYETIMASANRWQPPVHVEKAATDAQFERLLRTLIDSAPAVRLAVASHNVRAHAAAAAMAEAAGLAPESVEHQTLYRTAEGTSRALAALGRVARDYVPVGELLPGMAYLVRRVLENSSQAGFLLQSRAGTPAEELLRPPPSRPPTPPTVAPEASPFTRAPAAEWHRSTFRAAFDDALAATRARWGEHFELPGELRVADETLPAAETVAVRSPSHPAAEPVGVVDFAAVASVDRAVDVARAGQPVWAARPAGERTDVLRGAAELLHSRAAEFAAWVVHEGGRDRADAYAEVEEASDFLRYYATQAEALFGAFGDRVAPRGVAAVIPPWNFSLAIPCGMTAAALAAGNAAILKPAEQTPLIAHRLVALLHEAGVPREALLCLPGRGEEAGAALVEHPRVAMVAFTGSRAVGNYMHEAVAKVRLDGGGLKALVAEMGGKNPIVVFANADLDEAVAGILLSAFGHANQKCSAASRVLVAAPIADRLSERLVAAASSLRAGPADDPATQINPVIDAEAFERLRAAAALARSECEVLLDLFDLPDGDAGGGEDGGDTLVRGPLIVELPAARAATARTATEELFGPIVVLTRFDDEEEAYRLANATAYGLTAAVYSRSPLTIRRATRAIEAGNVYVNRHTTGARVGVEPFGGMRMSGTGPKAGGVDYLWAFTRRIDAPADRERPPAADQPAAADGAQLAAGVERWDAPIARRLEVVEHAAVLLGQRGDPAASRLFAATQAARYELAEPQPTVQVAGQRTELRYDTPRGLGLLHATGEQASWWLGAALLAGNAVVAAESAELAPAIAALREAGVPAEVLRVEPGGIERLLALAASPAVAFAATDAGPALTAELYRRLGPSAASQRSLKALVSALDGPQPGEPGFVRRFAWPKVIAVRTLRHGADLSLELADVGASYSDKRNGG